MAYFYHLQTNWQLVHNIPPVGAFMRNTFVPQNPTGDVLEYLKATSPAIQINNITVVTKNNTINSMDYDTDSEDVLDSEVHETLETLPVDHPLLSRVEVFEDSEIESVDDHNDAMDERNVSHEEDYPLSRRLSEKSVKSEMAVCCVGDQGSKLSNTVENERDQLTRNEEKPFGKHGGVTYNAKKKMYHAKIRADTKWRHGGDWKNALDAAHAVNLLCNKFGSELRNPQIGDCPRHVREKMVQENLCKSITTPDITEIILLEPDPSPFQIDGIEKHKTAGTNTFQVNEDARFDRSPSDVSNISESRSSEEAMENHQKFAVSSNDIDERMIEDEESLSLSTVSPRDLFRSEKQRHTPEAFEYEHSPSLSTPSPQCSTDQALSSTDEDDRELERLIAGENSQETPQQPFTEGQVISTFNGVTPDTVLSPSICGTLPPGSQGFPPAPIFITPSISETISMVQSPSNVAFSSSGFSSPPAYQFSHALSPSAISLPPTYPLAQQAIYQQPPVPLPQPHTYAAHTPPIIMPQHIPSHVFSQPHAFPTSPNLAMETSQCQSTGGWNSAHKGSPQVQKPMAKKEKDKACSSKPDGTPSRKQQMIESVCKLAYKSNFSRNYSQCKDDMRNISKCMLGQFDGGEASKEEIVNCVALELSKLSTEKNIKSYLEKNVCFIDTSVVIKYKYTWKESKFDAIRNGMENFGYTQTDLCQKLCYRDDILTSGHDFEKQYANEVMFNGKNVKAKANIEGQLLRLSATNETEIRTLKRFFDEIKPRAPTLPKPNGISFSTSSKGANSKNCKEITIRLGYNTPRDMILAEKVLGKIFGPKKLRTEGVMKEVNGKGVHEGAKSSPSRTN